MPSSLVSAVAPVLKTHLCTDKPTSLLWAGAGQKGKHTLFSSLIFWGLSCRALEVHADLLGGQGPSP